MRLEQALRAAARQLECAGIEQPAREARLLAAHLLGRSASAMLDRAALIDAEAYHALVARRAAREPMAFITGRRGFWTLDLDVSPDTQIPRADSEALIEAALAQFPKASGPRRILDLGTGTGCLLLAALSEFHRALGVGVDLSPASARLAARNAAGCGLASRALFLAGNWAESLVGPFDLILSNPPYIETAALRGLMPEVVAHEPPRALDGGTDGLCGYRRLLPDVSRLLSPSGVAVLELGQGQEASVAWLAGEVGLDHLTTRHDLGGIARAIVLAKPGRR
jgi:release factor glutamine methyltransferase